MSIYLIMINIGPVCKVYIVDQVIFVDIRPVSNIFLVAQCTFLDIGPVCNVYTVDHNRHQCTNLYSYVITSNVFSL